MCDDCAVTLTYHKVQHHLRCHYCGKTQRIMRKCGNCGGTDLSRLGAGTQRVEEEIEAHFPTARLLRMDLDTTSTKNAHHKILSQFERREADILIGTQMVAKGLDFGRVTLVGVINADAGMLLPDFRADERTFQLLTQVAGRAGRASRPGEVLLQTRNPQHPTWASPVRPAPSEPRQDRKVAAVGGRSGAIRSACPLFLYHRILRSSNKII